MEGNIIAVDFDGTLCTDRYPEIGMANEELIEYLKQRRAEGDRLILWTCRNEEQTKEAVEWCRQWGLYFDAVNDNLPEIVEEFGCNRRKIFANEYIDDHAYPVETYMQKSNMELWADHEVDLACRREKEEAKDSGYYYACRCLESALGAFRTLCRHGHSGFSIGITKSILNRLIDGRPLTPIEDVTEVWNDVSERHGLKNGEHMYQCKRMSSLFKEVYADGTVKYSDVDRYIGVNIDNPHASYHSNLIDRVMEELYPITMPYMPNDRPYEVYTEEFLVYPKNGDYDTVGILYAITPSMDRVEINRYFKETENEGFIEIDDNEYKQRKEDAEKRKRQFCCRRMEDENE